MLTGDHCELISTLKNWIALMPPYICVCGCCFSFFFFLLLTYYYFSFASIQVCCVSSPPGSTISIIGGWIDSCSTPVHADFSGKLAALPFIICGTVILRQLSTFTIPKAGNNGNTTRTSYRATVRKLTYCVLMRPNCINNVPTPFTTTSTVSREMYDLILAWKN